MRLQYKELGFSIEIDLDINFIPFLNNTIIIQIDFGTNYNSMELELNVEIKVNNHENHSYLAINSLIFLPPTKISFKKDFKLNVLDEYLILKFIFKKKPRSSKDHLGIINEGNTCYMNSIIQTLFNLQIVHKLIFENQNYNEIMLNFKELFNKLKTGTNAVKAGNILKLENDVWKSQQDAQEIFTKVIENFKPFSEKFKGKIETIISIINKDDRKNTQEFLFLHVDLQV